MSKNDFYIVSLDAIRKDFFDIEKGFQLTLALFNIFPILRNFIRKIGITHKFLIKENISNYKRVVFIHIAENINNGKTYIVTKRVID